jgi:type IV pili sensor histidine kinase/response regulator
MKQSTFLSTHSITAIRICVAGVCAVASVNLQANDLQVGRYSLITATPTQAQAALLAATIIVQFPERIQTVGEAVPHLLQRSGYRLARAESIGPDTAALFALPLPAVHRNLGPMTLRDALEILAGPAFHLVQDPVHRLITYERCATGRVAVEDTAPTIEMEVAQNDD